MSSRPSLNRAVGLVADSNSERPPRGKVHVDMLSELVLDCVKICDRIATGFHRNTMLNEEGGIDPLEFRYHAVADRTAVTGTST